MGGHHVDLFVLLSMGTKSATAATLSQRSSFTGIKVAILIGICGVYLALTISMHILAML
jgi:hypothetical protein